MATPAVAALAGLPAGVELLTAFAGLDLSSLTGFDLPLVLRAVYRLGNHTRALLLDAVAEVMRRKDPDGTGTGGWDAVAVHEVRAALTMSRTAANSLNHLAQDLHERLPQVLDAMRDGRLDQPRARVFSSWTGLLSEAHARAVVDALLPVAPKLTTGELIDEIRRVAIELDPDFAKRQHDHAVSQRRVHGAIGRDGTGHITAEGLSAEQIAAACDRLDAIGWHLKRAGHPGKLDHLRTDVFAGLLTGEFAGLTDGQLLEKLLANMQPTPGPQPSTSNPQPTGDEPGFGEPAPSDRHGDAASGSDATGDEDRTEDATTDEDRPDDNSPGDAPADDGSPDDDPGGGPGPDPPDPGGGEQLGGGVRLHRRGLRLWVGLGTIAGLDRRPGELLGWTLLHAELARKVAAAPTASWWYALSDRQGRPLQVGPVRRRPTVQRWGGEPVDVGGVEVWLQLTAAELAELVAHPPPGWERLIDDIRHRVANSPFGPPNRDPADRFPGSGLRRFLAIRDRRCMFPGCRIPSHRCQADHTVDHARGGQTVDSNLANMCAGDHALKTNHGWRARQKAAGHLIWTSPMGRDYERWPPRGPTHTRPPMANPSRPDDDWFRELTDEEYEDLSGFRPQRVPASVLEDRWWTDTCLTEDDRPDPNAPPRLEPEPKPRPEPKSMSVPVPPTPDPEDDIPF